MRTRLFALIMAALCGVGLVWGLSQAFRLRAAYARRSTYQRAFQLYKEKQYDQALAALDEALAFAPDDVALHRIGADIGVELKNPELAARYYDFLMERDDKPAVASAHASLGILYLNADAGGKRDVDKAIEHLRAALQLDDSLDDVRPALGIALVLKGDGKAARPYLEGAGTDEGGRPDRLAQVARLWLVADQYRGGDVFGAWITYQRLRTVGGLAAGKSYLLPLTLAMAFKVNTPGLSSAFRHVCLKALTQSKGLAEDVTAKYAMQIHTLAADALDRLGEEAGALREYTEAHRLDPQNPVTRRNLAYVLFATAGKASDPAERKRLLDESAGLYRDLLESGQLTQQEGNRVALALASRAWNEGRKADAEKAIAACKGLESPTVERMRASEAIEAKDLKGALAHLRRALELDSNQPDALVLVEQLTRKPVVRNFRANYSGAYDARPILAVTILPQAVPTPIAAQDVKLLLDGKPITPIVTTAECFYRPAQDLAPGEHQAEITITDSLGLAATGALTFTIAKDEDPPQIVGLVPAPDSETGTLEPAIAFRCTDPSGLNETSLSVVFEGRVGKSRTIQKIAVIDKGVYQVAFTRTGIKVGQRVHYGAGYFRFSSPLGEGTCTVRVGVSDLHNNRATRTWSFKVTAGQEEPKKAE